MRWPDAGAKIFPSPHRAEPEDLRQNIIDELADHLALAAEDEMVKHGRSNEGAWQRAIERFGNPDSVARKLWWDAMKERVMRDWIHSGIAAVSAIVVVLVALLVVNSMNQMQTTQVQLIEALKMMNQPAPPVGETLVVEVRRGSETGPPADGVKVTLIGTVNADKKATVSLDTDAEGRVKFSPLPQGQYDIKVYDPKSTMETGTGHSILAGIGSSLKVIAPDYEAVPTKCALDRSLPFPNERVLAGAQIGIYDRIDDLVWISKKTIWIGNDGCYELPGITVHHASEVSMDQEFSGPVPTVLLPPGKIEDSPRNRTYLFFRYPKGGATIVSSGDRSNELQLERSENTIIAYVSDEQVREASKWLKAYTFDTRWPDRKSVYSQYWSNPGQYLLASAPFVDMVSASMSETDGKAALTVQPNRVVEAAEMIGGEGVAAVFKWPDLVSKLGEFPAGSHLIFTCAGIRAGELRSWTGSEWNAEPGATFNVNVLPGTLRVDDTAKYDVTDFVKDSTAGILVQHTPGPVMVMSLDPHKIYTLDPGGIVIRHDASHEYLLPHLLVVSDNPPPDL